MREWYASLDIHKKELLMMGLIALIGFAVQIPLFFVNVEKGYSYPLGWLLGSAAEILGYLSILFMGNALTNQEQKTGTALFAAFSAFLRFFLYAAALIVAAICTFKSEWFGGFDGFNLWTTFGAMVPFLFVLLLLNFKHRGTSSHGGVR